MIELYYKDRIRNLSTKASGVVKSNKFFPVFLINGKEYIFKPLSKTKPLTTPMFAYAEKYWSEYLSGFSAMPKYELAICHGYGEEEPKYYDYGTLVENILSDGEEMINLYEYFEKNPDKAVDIHNYENYCMMFYDYTMFFETKFFKENYDMAAGLASQILMSSLSGDENFHYENVQLIKKNDSYRIAPMLDHEFSVMFLYPDNLATCKKYYDKYLNDLSKGVLRKNLNCICSLFPNLVKQFVDYLKNNNPPTLYINKDFFFPCNSDSYAIGRARYKENDERKAKVFEMLIEMKELDSYSVCKFINSIIHESTEYFIRTVEIMI